MNRRRRSIEAGIQALDGGSSGWERRRSFHPSAVCAWFVTAAGGGVKISAESCLANIRIAKLVRQSAGTRVFFARHSTYEKIVQNFHH